MPRDLAALRRAVQPLVGHPRVEPLIALLLRARLVLPSSGFLVAELRARGRSRPPRLYRLRAAPAIRVAVRHGSGDVVTLGEVFHNHDYAPPREVDAVLVHCDRPLRILDLGANVGMFGAWAHHRWPGAEVTAYEPDADNAAVHELVLTANPALRDRWTLVRAAAGAADGEARFAAGEVALSHLLADGEEGAGATVVVPVRDVLSQIADSDLVKIDIEGGEWSLLQDPRFAAAPPPVVVAEYHLHLSPDPLDARRAALALLHEAGYSTIPIVHHDEHGAGMLWAYRA